MIVKGGRGRAKSSVWEGAGRIEEAMVLDNFEKRYGDKNTVCFCRSDFQTQELTMGGNRLQNAQQHLLDIT